jgi:hypothetical protein
MGQHRTTSGDIVYGLLYELSETDQESLDKYEHVPLLYPKEYMSVEIIPRRDTTRDN